VCETSDADSALRERLERTRREAEYSKKKLQQQHEEAVEELEAAKKLLERKVHYLATCSVEVSALAVQV